MQCVYIDVTAEQLAHNGVLRSYVSQSVSKREDCCLGGEKYCRLSVPSDSHEHTEQLLVQMTVEESIHWVLQKWRHRLSRLSDRARFDTLLWERMGEIQLQLELLIQHDMLHVYHCQTGRDLCSWNMEGYLLFSAKKPKWMIETLVQDVYQSCIEEQEREEFIALLQFCASAQQSLLDEVYITLRKDQFTMTDVWGNDLQQIYLEVLPSEEYEDVQMHDLLLSILMTMMPDSIYLFVTEEPLTAAEQAQQENLIRLLQQIFGKRLILAPHAYKL